MSKKHAKLSASGSSKWINCPGSVEAEKGLERKGSNIYADEGTLAHELADICLKTHADTNTFIDKEIKVESDGRTLSCVVDKEMAIYVQEYIDYVKAHETPNCQRYTESKVDFSNVVPGGFGTMDASILDYDTGTCHIFDLKYGRGHEVSAIENTQGQMYALGLYNELSCLNVIKKFVIHIVQPRKYNFSSWEISIEDLIVFGKMVNEKAKLALSKNAPRIPGEKQCEWCNAKANCPALNKLVEDSISVQFEDLTKESAQELTLEQKKRIIDNSKLIDSFVKAVEADVYNLMINGNEFPGYKLVEGRSNRKWIDEAEKVLVEKLGDEAYKKSLIGIGDAEIKLNKKEVELLTVKPIGNPTMAKDTDKRPKMSNTNDCFENLDNDDL